MSGGDRLLSALERVRAKGPSSWSALCPCHPDRTPSLHVDELPDGTVLVHCFGCGANGQQVAEAIGIPRSELFPPRRPYDTPDGPGGRGPLHRPRHTGNLLATAAHEALVVVLGLEREWNGGVLSIEERDRLFEAARRLREFAS